MKKTIIINENSFVKLKNLFLNESSSNYPEFGTPGKKGYIHYGTYLNSILNIQNLHSDRYKDYELEEAYNDWAKNGYDKNCDEYFIYVSKFKDFMQKFLSNLSYTTERLNGPLHSLLLDPKWVKSLNGRPNWKYSDINSGYGGDEWQCFYTTILKLFQNPCIWNDFFFNPQLSEYKQNFDKIIEKIDEQINLDRDRYTKLYKPLLPSKEFAQIRNFIKGVKVIDGKIERVNNANPEIFVDFSSFNETDIDDEEY